MQYTKEEVDQMVASIPKGTIGGDITPEMSAAIDRIVASVLPQPVNASAPRRAVTSSGRDTSAVFKAGQVIPVHGRGTCTITDVKYDANGNKKVQVLFGLGEPGKKPRWVAVRNVGGNDHYSENISVKYDEGFSPATVYASDASEEASVSVPAPSAGQ